MILHVENSLVTVCCGNTICGKITIVFFLFALLPIQLQAETVYITDSLLVGLHEEKSIDSAILKVLPTGTALEVIKRNGESVNVRDKDGVVGWISNNYLISNNPDENVAMDSSAAQVRIRDLEAELQNLRMQQTKPHQWQIIDPEEIVKIKNDNKKLNQQINSEKLKSGELQARLAELKNQISQNGSKKGLTDKIKLLTEKNVQLEDEIKQFQQGRKIAKPFVDDLNIHNPVVLSGIALLLGLFIGIILMDWRARRRHGGLRF